MCWNAPCDHHFHSHSLLIAQCSKFKMAPEQKIAGTARMLKPGRETHPQPSSAPRDRYIAWQWGVQLTKNSWLKTGG